MRRLTIALLTFGCLALTSQPPRPPRPSDFRPLLLRPIFAQTISKPFVPLLVEVLWLRALNAIGLKDSEQKNRALHEYGVVITELDPRFRVAYEYIGLNIPFAVARNTWSGGDLESDMFERGIRAFPRDLKFHMFLGFSLFHHQRKFAEASEAFARAARLPDALDWMAPLATRLRSHSGEAVEALEMTRDLLASNLSDDVRAELERRVSDLEVEVLLQVVDRASQAYAREFGVAPASVLELRARRLYDGPLVDPQGGFISVTADGKATSTSLNRRLEIYE